MLRWDAKLEYMMNAVYRGKLAAVTRALDLHPEWVNCQNLEVNQRPIHIAAHGNHVDILRTLLERGAEVDLRDFQGLTPLHRAAQGDAVEAARMLLDHGADINADDGQGWTPLSHCAGRPDERAQVAALLRERGAAINLYSTLSLRDDEAAWRLLNEDPQAIAKTVWPDSLLMIVVFDMGLDALAASVSPDRMPNEQRAQLIESVVNSRIDLLEALIAKGAPMDRGYELLSWAIADVPHPRLIEVILRAGALTSPDAKLRHDRLLKDAAKSPYGPQLAELLRSYGVA